MNFLALITGLVLDRWSGLGAKLRRDGWFAHCLTLVEGLGLSGWPAVAAAIGLPLFVVGLLLQVLASILFGLPWLVAAVLLLLYSFGRIDVEGLQEHYRSQCRREDFQGAWLAVHESLHDVDIEPGQDTAEVHEVIQSAFLYAGYQRWFAVLFYFLLLGPLGALAYRCCQLLPAGEQRRWLLFVADWVPARLLAATFTLAGDFSASVDEFWQTLRQRTMPAGDALYAVAYAAAQQSAQTDSRPGLQMAQQNESQAALLRRSAVCWIAVVSVLVILG